MSKNLINYLVLLLTLRINFALIYCIYEVMNIILCVAKAVSRPGSSFPYCQTDHVLVTGLPADIVVKHPHTYTMAEMRAIIAAQDSITVAGKTKCQPSLRHLTPTTSQVF